MRMKMVTESQTLKDAAKEFLAYKKTRKVRERTLKDYPKYIDQFIEQSENSMDILSGSAFRFRCSLRDNALSFVVTVYPVLDLNLFKKQFVSYLLPRQPCFTQPDNLRLI